LQWTIEGHTFVDLFRILPLGSYDGIIGLDWLAKFSPMTTHWAQGWISFARDDQVVVLYDESQCFCTHAVVELHLVQECDNTTDPVVPPEIQQILDTFAPVFTTPTGLPPHRQYDHHIPLIHGARPISIRPYRVAPHLKDEIEK
jgi:hypothetical protein